MDAKPKSSSFESTDFGEPELIEIYKFKIA